MLLLTVNDGSFCFSLGFLQTINIWEVNELSKPKNKRCTFSKMWLKYFPSLPPHHILYSKHPLIYYWTFSISTITITYSRLIYCIVFMRISLALHCILYGEIFIAYVSVSSVQDFQTSLALFIFRLILYDSAPTNRKKQESAYISFPRHHSDAAGDCYYILMWMRK